MKKVRVMHIIDSLGIGGAEKVVATIVELLDINKFEVSVCYFYDGSIANELRKKNIQLHQIKFSLMTMPVFLFKLVKLMHQQKIDIVHTHLFPSDILGRIAARLAGVKAVFCTLHTSYLYKSKRDPINRLKLLLDTITGNWMCDQFIAVSNLIKSYHIELQKISGQKMYVLGNPLHIEDYTMKPSFNPKRKKKELGLSSDSLVIINVANLTEVKGQRFLIDAMAKIIQQCATAELIIAGEGPRRQDLNLISQNLGIQDHIHLVGRRNDVAELLAMSDIFVLSSLNEGVSIALLEAMAMAKSIVATNVGSNSEVIQDQKHGLLVPSMNSEALANAIIDLLQNRVRAEKLGMAARQEVIARFDAKLISIKTEELYLQCLKEKKSE